VDLALADPDLADPDLEDPDLEDHVRLAAPDALTIDRPVAGPAPAPMDPTGHGLLGSQETVELAERSTAL
jgi:hypothetical protein